MQCVFPSCVILVVVFFPYVYETPLPTTTRSHINSLLYVYGLFILYLFTILSFGDSAYNDLYTRAPVQQKYNIYSYIYIILNNITILKKKKRVSDVPDKKLYKCR